MPPRPWPIVTDGLYGDVPIGMFPANDTSHQLVMLPFGGLETLVQLPSCTEIREGWSWGNYMYWLARNGGQSILYRVDTAGGYSALGTISTSFTGPAWIKNNQTQLCVVDGVSGYVYTPSNNHFDQITDADFPGAGGLTYQDGYGIFFNPNTNSWFFSAINNFGSIDAGDFYAKEATTDNIRFMRCVNRLLYISGEKDSTEVWYNSSGDNTSIATATFKRNSESLINMGGGAAKADSDMVGTMFTWLTAQGQLAQASGTNSKIVSNGMFGREVSGDGTPEHPGYSTFSDALAFSFKDQDHLFHQVTFPSAGVTWVLDGTTGLMLKRRSYKLSGGYGRHRANCYVWHNGKHYVGDFENGKIYEMSSAYYDDDGHNIQRVLYSQEIFGGRQLISFPNVQVTVEAGMGLAGGVAPQIGLEFSADRGKTWSNIVSRSVGATGQYGWQANWSEMGSGYSRIYRVTMTDPILWRVLGVDLGV